jgi:hypothetical protein
MGGGVVDEKKVVRLRRKYELCDLIYAFHPSSSSIALANNDAYKETQQCYTKRKSM